MIYYGHTAVDTDGKRLPESYWQLLRDHLRNVAKLARDFGEPLGLGAEAEFAGWLHDLGKYADKFQGRLRDPSICGINHWIAGAYVASQTYKDCLIPFVIDGHHTGMPAFVGGDSPVPLQQSLLKFINPESRLASTKCSESSHDLLGRFEKDGLSKPILDTPLAGFQKFDGALRTRMLFSCLVDADFLDTEKHFDSGTASDRNVPSLNPDLALEILTGSLALKSGLGELNELRRQLLADCFSKALMAPGLFTLTAPTGSGKTLASLAFALRHISHANSNVERPTSRQLKRIIVVIPFTSIIEQTAEIYRSLFEKEFGPDFVLEHHSTVTPRERKDDQGRDAEEARLKRARLASENWSSPIVVTTSVQFFESLFSNKPSDCRKLHNIARSVVIFDEVQTLPPRLVPSFLSAVSLLSQEPYGCTALFMTATQPAFASARKALPFNWEPTPIESNSNALAETMRRTRIQLPLPGVTLTWDEVAELMVKHNQALCVLNTTKDARALFKAVKKRVAVGVSHLSARMCPAHRQLKLAEIRRRLAPDSNLPCLLISTQLIEAGVDVDFPIAFRALGPLDSMIQTAGRCNREGRQTEPGLVIIFRPSEGSALPKAYEQVMQITEAFLHGEEANKLHLPETYARYFAALYKLTGPQEAKADKVFQFSEKFDFPAAAEACRLVDNNTRNVLVKWGDGDQLIKKLKHQKHLSGAEWRKVQRFSVNLYEHEFQEAKLNGVLACALEDVEKWYWNSNYDEDLGACHLEGGELVC